MKIEKNKQQDWHDHVAAAERYPGSHEEYCRVEGVSSPALRYWRKKLEKQTRPNRLVAIQNFIPVEITPEQQVSVGLPDPRWLAELIIHLSGGVK